MTAVGSLEGNPPSSPLLTLFRRGNIPRGVRRTAVSVVKPGLLDGLAEIQDVASPTGPEVLWYRDLDGLILRAAA